MKIGIATTGEEQKQEILGKQISDRIIVQWVGSTRELQQVRDANYWIDCTFSGNESPNYDKPTLIHAPWLTLADVEKDNRVARFCAWPSFISRDTWEIAVAEQSDTLWLTELMTLLEWKFLLVKDEPGLIAPRIVSSIINEAYHALQAGISSAEEIDIAMKLGTNYPYGPLEWCQRIGPEQVYRLLKVLSEKNTLYEPAFYVQ